jgi:hypothetical protein
MKYIILLVLLTACAGPQDWYPNQIYRKNDVLIYNDVGSVQFFRPTDIRDCGLVPGNGSLRWKYSGDIIEMERNYERDTLVLYKIDKFTPGSADQFMAKGKDWQIFLTMWQPRSRESGWINILYVNEKEQCATVFDVRVKYEEVIPGTYRPVPHG